MQDNSDGLGGRRVSGVNPTTPSFVSSLSSAHSVSFPSIDCTGASVSTRNQAYVAPPIRRSPAPGSSTVDNMLTRGRPVLSLESVPPYTPDRTLIYRDSNAKTSMFSAQSMSMVVKTSSTTHAINTDDADQLKSVKHLTCFYWRKYGKCSKADEVCLYAHYNTGHIAEEPMHMAPGLPAVAGRNARSQLAFHQNWRSCSHSAFETPQRLEPAVASYTILQELSRDSFRPGPQSRIPERFMGTSITQPKIVSCEEYLMNAKVLRDIIDLQTHMAQVGQERFRSLGQRIGKCRESLYSSASAMGEWNIQQHKDLVGTLVNQFMAVERDAQIMADKLQFMKLEVARGLEKLS
ncbi:hypothetical protein MMC26_007481 [Xylographa opegraphella]|nr:hypothetical protein [Xylographa opegraphella]